MLAEAIPFLSAVAALLLAATAFSKEIRAWFKKTDDPDK